ncbi:hypothetical protein GQ602_004342 [Ophiocordyceps camponoti-floridani]|uniref:DUF7598 domain-containing protein n=1 Tax=Ophiocordyceps camponoti-floridani TaxID=2030778 RepID=A0A8H4VDQ8_9HYPO|nr:hypothetical protein GQ602_004342 [Ophiocordyceps camponoti-floridani]
MFEVDTAALRGAGMVVLQMMRACTVITLASVAASCWVLILKVDRESSYFVFECATDFFRFILCLVLIISEFPVINFVKGYFRRNWPVVSDQHGLVWLGIIMLLIGCDMFGNLNRPAYEAEKLGPHYSKLVLASSVLVIVFGGLNMICSFIWRDASDGITCRDVRSNGSLAESRQALPDYDSGTFSKTSAKGNHPKTFMNLFWKRNKTEKSRPVISAPTSINEMERGGHFDDDRRSPIVPGLKRPNTALHPMHTHRSSMYSEAHMSRF